MYTRQYRTTKKSSTNHHAPSVNQFAPRPFVVQPQLEEAALQQNQTPEIQAKKEQENLTSNWPDVAMFTTNRPAPAAPPRLQMKFFGKTGDQSNQKLAPSLQMKCPVCEAEETQKTQNDETEKIQLKEDNNLEAQLNYKQLFIVGLYF